MAVETEVTSPVADEGARAETASEVTDDHEIDTDRVDAPEDDETDQGGDEGSEGDETGDPSKLDAETDEVDYEGQKFKVPKPLKDAFLRHADYTRKTQAISERERLHGDLDTRQAALTQQVEAVQTLREDVGKVETLKTQIAAFEGVDWVKAYEEAAEADNPAAENAKVARAYAKFQALQVESSTAEKTLNEKIDAHLKSQEDQRTQRIQDVGKVLAEKIPDFGREKAQALMEFAAQEGVTVQEMQAVDDPRTWLLLNRAHALQAENAALKAQLATKTTVDRHAKAQDTTPAASVKGNAAPQTGPSDRQGTEAWMEKRKAQVAKQRA